MGKNYLRLGRLGRLVYKYAGAAVLWHYTRAERCGGLVVLLKTVTRNDAAAAASVAASAAAAAEPLGRDRRCCGRPCRPRSG